MKHIETPLSAFDMLTRILVLDVKHEPVFQVLPQYHIPDPAAVAAEIVLAVNAHDALVAACKAAKQHLDAMRLESGMGNVMLPFERAAFEQVDRELTAAIEKAEYKIEGESEAQ